LDRFGNIGIGIGTAASTPKRPSVLARAFSRGGTSRAAHARLPDHSPSNPPLTVIHRSQPEPETLPPPPAFELDWRAVAAVLEAGAPGVDAAAVTTALVGLSETAAEGADGSSAPTAADERPLVFAHLSYDELRKAASAAPEGTPLRDADDAVVAAAEAHAEAEDPDKGEFCVTPALIAGLFRAFAETDEAAYREAVTARRTIAHDAAKAAHAAAAAAAEEAAAAAAAARETFEAQAREHAAAMAAWNQDDDEDDGPGPGPDPDALADADEQVRLAKDAATVARRAAAAAKAARSEPAEVTKTYALAEDFFSGVDGAEATPENAVRRLADLAAAGLPVIGLVNLARERIDASADANDANDAANDATTADGDVAGPEEDDEYPPLVSALMDAHARAVADSLEYDAPARLVAVLPLDFPRGEDVDAAALASATAATCGVAALAADEYAFWRAEADVARVPGDYAETVTRALARARAEHESRTNEGEKDAEDAEDAEASAEAEDAEASKTEAEQKTEATTKKTASLRQASPTAMDFVEHRAYARVLTGIPHERVTCAVVLDAMVTQVCASACDPEDVQRGSDVAAAEAARVAVSAALGALKLEHVPETRPGLGSCTRGTSRFGFGTTTRSFRAVGTGSMSMERTMDDAFTSRGAGFDESRGVQSATTRERDPLFPEGDVPDPLDEPENARVTLLHAGDAAAALRSTRAPGAFAATLAARPTLASVVTLDPDAVEAKMAALAHAPGARRAGMPPEPELDDDARGARKTALATFLATENERLERLVTLDAKASLAAAERRELMCAVVDRALPAGVRGDHGEEVRARRHWEPLTREAYAAAVGTCVASTGAMAVSEAYHAFEDALLVACHAAPSTERMDAAPYALNRAAPWCEFVGAFVAAFRAREASRARRDARDAERAARAADDEARRLETEASDLAAMDPAAREAREASDAAAAREAEEARRAAEEEEAAAWAWDGSDAGENDAGDEDGPSSDVISSEPDRDGRRWIVDAEGCARRRRTTLVPMASVAYSVEADASRACAENAATRRLYPSARGAAVVASPDGGVDVVVAGARLGLRLGDGGSGCRLVASLADQPGAAIVVARAPEDPPPPPPPEPAEAEEAEEGEEGEDGEDGEDGEGAKTDDAPAEDAAKPPKPVFVQYTSDVGLCVTVTTERVVMQSRVDHPLASLAAGSRPASLAGRVDADADVETSRAILPDGSTVRRTLGGSTEILRPDGNVARRDTENDAWIGTNARGIRWAQRDAYAYQPPPPTTDEGEEKGDDPNGDAPAEADESNEATDSSEQTEDPPRPGELVTPPATFVKPLSAATVIDPETRAWVTSREDLTLVVEHPDETTKETRGGSEEAPLSGGVFSPKTLSDTHEKTRTPPLRSLAVHADGTRVCRDAPAGCLWRVEKEGFATTHADAVTKDIAVDLGSGRVSVDADGVSCVALGANGSLGAICADVSGLVAFVPGDADVFETEREVDEAYEAASRLLYTPLARARRALRAAATPEGEARGGADVGAGDPDVDGAFIFDLRRGALRFVDEAARRKELGFVPFRRDASESKREREASDALGPSASVGTLAADPTDDADPLGDETLVESHPATPAAFLARAHEFRAACAFAELDPPPPPPPEADVSGEDVSGGEAGGGSDAEAASETEKASETDAAAPAEAPPDPETVAAEASSATTATLATTVAEDPAPEPVVIAAPLVPPRVFVAYPDQDEYFEVLSSDAFAAYRAERLADATCAAAAAPVSGPEAASGAVSHTFLTPLRPAPAPARADARARAVAEAARRRGGRAARRAQPARALRAGVPGGAGDARRAAHRGDG
jgi:hypothetical protein